MKLKILINLLLVCDKIEKNLYLIVTTIVKDKLQNKDSEAIHDLLLAKIKILILIGDKMNMHII